MGNKDTTSHAAVWVKHELAKRRLREVVGALEERGIPVLPVKGIISAYTLYDDVIERPMSDVDLRIRPRDFRRAVAIARERGWPIHAHAPRLWEAEIHFDDCPVEIECTIGPPGLCGISVAEMLERATVSERFGFPCREPEIHDHALVLCINAFKDMLAPPAWAFDDVARVLQRSDFDPARFGELVRRGGMVTATWIVLDRVADVYNDEVAARVRASIGRPPRPGYAWLYRRMAAQRVLRPYDTVFVPSLGSDHLARASWALGHAGLGWLRGGVLRRLARS